MTGGIERSDSPLCLATIIQAAYACPRCCPLLINEASKHATSRHGMNSRSVSHRQADAIDCCHCGFHQSANLLPHLHSLPFTFVCWDIHICLDIHVRSDIHVCSNIQQFVFIHPDKIAKRYNKETFQAIPFHYTEHTSS